MTTTEPGVDRIQRARALIDTLDQQIVELLARRTATVRELTEFKNDEAAVRSPDRVRQVLERVRGLAEAQGMPADIAVATYRTLIDELTRMQLERLAVRRAGIVESGAVE